MCDVRGHFRDVIALEGTYRLSRSGSKSGEARKQLLARELSSAVIYNYSRSLTVVESVREFEAFSEIGELMRASLNGREELLYKADLTP